MAVAHVLGFPRIGAKRELKFALDSFWRGETAEAALAALGRELRARHWRLQREAGLDFATVGDFAWYDHVLQTLAHLGGLPARFGFEAARLTLPQYFAAARGAAGQPAMELTKWFDTNYHYLVPEWSADTRFEGGVDWLFEEIAEARALGHPVRAALLGPLTLLQLGKSRTTGEARLEHKLDLLAPLVRAYQRLLARLRAQGVEWVQVDEPILALDLDESWLEALATAYASLVDGSPKILLATYFDSAEPQQALLKSLPVAGLHLDLVRGREQLPRFLKGFSEGKVLSLGVVNGRNIWRCDLDAALAALQPAHERLGERLWVSASCSLLHVPIDLGEERRLDPELRLRLAFAAQKLEEIAALKRALEQGPHAIGPALALSRKAIAVAALAKSAGASAGAAFEEHATRRRSPYAVRARKQRQRLQLPPLPTTTIGSFPQTSEIRKARAAYKRGEIGPDAYREAMRSEIRLAVARQEALGLDVLVHGEAERNDMVEYFGEQLRGYAFTANGWVQSYGSRCVKPPVIHADVSRPGPMTVEWTRYAQSLTRKPMKGMLTGPITMLQWSFVREDLPREEVAIQIAAALREEVADLERAGIAIVQIDEPALREGLPLRRRDWEHYLEWAVRAFRLASSGVADETQVHTHMCYAEFGDILPAIAGMDADVITIEASRSGMELLEAFGTFRYPNEIGPGLYDIHSPRVPDAGEMARLLEKAARVVPAERLWVNPDCGLKTRGWAETEAALAAMIEAARRLREGTGRGARAEALNSA